MTIKPMRVENMAKKKQNKTFSLKKDAGAWMLLIPSAFLTYLLTIRPQALGIFWSFFNMKGFTVEDFVGFDNYRRVVTDTAFAQTFLNTWIYVLWSLVIGLALPFVIAIVMNELIRARKTVRVITYLPAIMPAVAVSMLWYYMYYPDASGLLNMLLAKFGREPYVWLQDSRFTILYIIISMTWSGAGGTALYYFAGLQGINRELYEAAMMDGAGFFRRIRVVTIPQMSGMLILFAIKQCIAVFNIVDQPMQMTGGGPNNASMSLGLLNYRYAFVNYKPQFTLALGVIMLIILSLFSVIYFAVNKRIEENQM